MNSDIISMPKTFKHTPLYQSVSANRHENSIHYALKRETLLYARSNSLVLYDPLRRRLLLYLHGHTAEINGLCYVLDHGTLDPTGNVISTSYDKTAIIWDLTKGEAEGNLLYKLPSPDNNVFTSRCCISQQSQNGEKVFLSITSTLDCSIFVWLNDQLLSTIKTQYYCFDSKIHTVKYNDEDITFLFLAGSDNKVHVFQIADNSLIELFDITGHNDWIKCLDTLNLKGRSLEFLVASASQDTFVRVWHMKIVSHDIDPTQVRTTVSPTLKTKNVECQLRLTATLETVLSGHDNIIHGLCWIKQADESLLLLTCSADKTIILWKSSVAQPEDSSHQGERHQLNRYDQCPASAEVWRESLKFGETGETNLPFLGICVGNSHDCPDSTIIFAVSLRGAIHSWLYNDGKVEARPTITGHYDSVTDLCWDKSGSYLLSGSLDKTCRLHTRVVDGSPKETSEQSWYEIARPVVHGHELNCLTSIGFSKFAIGAEEKTIRTFEATQFFMRNLNALSTVKVPDCHPNEWSTITELPKHAQLPALGLSNKAAQAPYHVKDVNDENISATQTWYESSKLVEQLSLIDHLDKLPTEEILLQSTLWWESNKLFGHGNELYTMAATTSGSYLASASKANRKDLASIIVWECSRFRKAATIEHHSLTVTRLRFSPDDKYLLSVSRDRTWCLSERTGAPRPAFKKIVGTTKSNSGHDRIIWDCSWTHDSKYFVTVSRDKKICLWALSDVLSREVLDEECPIIKCVTSTQLSQSIQAVDSPNCQPSPTAYWFAFGLEDGSLEMHRVEPNRQEPTWQQVLLIKSFHHLPIRRLAFAPSSEKDLLMLASGGDDCVLKVTLFELF